MENSSRVCADIQPLGIRSNALQETIKKNRYLNCFQEIMREQAECIRARIGLLDRVVCFTIGSLLGGLTGGSLKIHVVSIIYLLTLSTSSALLLAWKGPFFMNKMFPRGSLKEELAAIFNQRLMRLLASDPRLADLFDPSTLSIKDPFSKAIVRIDCAVGDDLNEVGRYFPEPFLQGIGKFRLALSHEDDRQRRAFRAKLKELRELGKITADEEHKAMSKYLSQGLDLPKQFN